LLEKSGDKLSAEKWYKKIYERYPGSISLAELAGFYWRNNKYDKAAEILSDNKYIMRQNWKFILGQVFMDAFSDTNEAEKAFDALISIHINAFSLRELVMFIEDKDKHELAFKLFSKLTYPGYGQIKLHMATYAALKAWKGEKVALEWLKTKVPANLWGPLAQMMYEDKEDNLLWDLITEPQPNDYPSCVWAVRSAATLRDKNLSNKYGKTVQDYFSKNSVFNSSECGYIGKYLMGLITEKELLTTATDIRQKCAMTYYIGAKHLFQGDYDGASDWFHLSVELGNTSMFEYSFAYGALYTWFNSGRFLNPECCKKY
jgi:hypothetical protein